MIAIIIMMDKTDRVASHHPELVDVPVGEVGLVQDCHLLVIVRIMIAIRTRMLNVPTSNLDVSIVDGLSVIRPIVVTLLSPFLDTPARQSLVRPATTKRMGMHCTWLA